MDDSFALKMSDTVRNLTAFSTYVLKKQSILFMIQKTDTSVTILFKKLHVLV